MAPYNPNSIWGSKKKEYVYVPGKGPQPSSLTGPQAREAAGEEDKKGPQPTPPSGSPPSLPTDQKSGGHGLVWFGVGLVVLLGVIAAVVVILKNKPTPQLTLTFNTPSQTFVGDPFILTISFSNDSNQTLQNAQLSVLLPQGISFVNQSEDQRVLEQTVGNLAPGDASTTEIDLVATTNPNSIQHIQATMTYGSSANTTAEFQTTGETDVAIGSTALNFSFNIPQNVFSGGNFPITVNYNNQSPQDVSDAQFTMTYPSGFQFVSSSLPIIAGSNNNVWDLGKVPAGASSSFTVVGSVSGPSNALYAVAGTLNATFEGQTYPVATQSADIVIAQAPLSLAITLNGSSSYIAGTNDELNYLLTYTNNSNATFQSVNITAKLTGAMFDFSKLHTDGSFNSISDTITWNTANDPALGSLAPGQSGSVNFTLNTKTAYPIKLPSDKNFLLKALGTITSPTVPPNTGGGTGTQSVVELDNEVGGQMTVAAEGFRHDPWGIANSGPFPPKVNQASTYTVHWIITNYSTDASSVTVSAYLQSGSTFTGVATSTIMSSTPTYDSGTGLITWTIPFVPATTGITDKSLETAFQISNTPAVNQVGQSVTLLGPTSLTATDGYTGQTLSASDQAITTDLPDDPSVSNVDNKTVSQ